MVGFGVGGGPQNYALISSTSRNTVEMLAVITRSTQIHLDSPRKMIDGCSSLASANNALTSLSPSPTWRRTWAADITYCSMNSKQSICTHLEVSDDALMLKNFA